MLTVNADINLNFIWNFADENEEDAFRTPTDGPTNSQCITILQYVGKDFGFNGQGYF